MASFIHYNAHIGLNMFVDMVNEHWVSYDINMCVFVREGAWARALPHTHTRRRMLVHFYIICNIIVNRDKRILFYLYRNIHTSSTSRNVNFGISVTYLLLLVFGCSYSLFLLILPLVSSFLFFLSIVDVIFLFNNNNIRRNET